MLKRFLIILVIILFAITVGVSKSFALTSPDFPACTSPSGTLRVEYNEGTHGVVGNSSEFKGKDTVYTINESQTLQCLCTSDGQGIQTNWWKIPSLTGSEIQVLKNSGWYYVPNGALWGLDDVPYMAKNNNYTCVGGLGGIGGGSVLGLAMTGKIARLFYGLIGIGSISLLLGVLLHRKGKGSSSA